MMKPKNTAAFGGRLTLKSGINTIIY